MNKKLSFFVIIILIAVLFTACAKDTSSFEEKLWTAPDYTKGEIVSSLSALQLFREVVESKETNAHRTSSLSLFVCATSGLENNQSEVYEAYQTDTAYYKQTITQGSGIVASKNSGYKKFYSDGSNYYSYENKKSQKVDLEATTFDGTMTKLDNFSEIAFYIDYIEFSSYNFDDEYISDEHNDKVYKLNDKYYFTVTLKTKDNEGAQSDTEAVIIENIGTSPESFLWTQDTTITCEVSVINGEYRLTARRMCEYYEGKLSGLKGICTNVTAATYDYSITQIPSNLITLG